MRKRAQLATSDLERQLIEAYLDGYENGFAAAVAYMEFGVYSGVNPLERLSALATQLDEFVSERQRK